MSSQPIKVKSTYEYVSQHDDDLHFPVGQIINIIQDEDDEWYSGEYIDNSGVKQHGIFPKNYVEIYQPSAPSPPDPDCCPKTDSESKDLKLGSESSVSETSSKSANLQSGPASIASHTLESTPQRSDSKTPGARSSPIINSSRATESSPPNRIPSSKKSTPPHVFEKPVSNSFKDRIAAFNKASSPIPFKPGDIIHTNSNIFVKKPFIAPPPSKNAFVPGYRDHPVINNPRRGEDHHTIRKEYERPEKYEEASFVPLDSTKTEQTKTTSLKERIALLQKQQIEQASRLADAALKKVKVNCPPKKQSETTTQKETAEQLESTLPMKIESKAENNSRISDENEPKELKRSKSTLSIKMNPGVPSVDGNDAASSITSEDIAEPEEKEELLNPLKNKILQKAAAMISHDSTVESEVSIGKDEKNDEDEDENLNAEIKRKEELIARMAKMSGGMGMHGILGLPGSSPMPGIVIPPKSKGNNTKDEISKKEDSQVSTAQIDETSAISLPGMAQLKSQEVEQDESIDPNMETSSQKTSPTAEKECITPKQNTSPLDSTLDYTLERTSDPILVNNQKRVSQTQLLDDNIPISPSTGSESDDELSPGMQESSVTSLNMEHHNLPEIIEKPNSFSSFNEIENSLGKIDPTSPASPTNQNENKRASRLPPPIPIGILPHQMDLENLKSKPSSATTQTPTSEQRITSPAISTSVISDESNEIIAYEGDCDTDIASNTHQSFSKAHGREIKIEDSIPLTSASPVSSHTKSSETPRASVPEPLQLISNTRLSIDMPKSAPPPPPSNLPTQWEDTDEIQRNSAPKKRAPSVPSLTAIKTNLVFQEDNIYSASPLQSPYDISEQIPPQLPPRESVAPLRESMEILRSSTGNRRSIDLSRISIDLSRISLDSSFIATDVDLAPNSFWWTQPNGIPLVFQGRNDILFESDETSSSVNGKTLILKEIYILFQDYSQTIVTAQYDTQNPAEAKLEQRHEQPPSRLRQDQLEQAYERIGRGISEGVIAHKEVVVGDGTPQGLIIELLSPFKDALFPVGIRAYGALVYGNIANASVQQNDEIRAGDIISFRNCKFQGKHGPLSGKYTDKVGDPHHVGIVFEWDGTKKKIRAWEQGRDSKKVKLESFKLDDLRSGEVKVWRVMPRSWVGWEGQN